ncbi:flavodoxin domain-containing protein [Streptomyces roseus]|uniref:flavodoxin domain-containing protein n=1 Tax=Streptomyces roseus TaxID=66430 RepID=UPI00382DE960
MAAARPREDPPRDGPAPSKRRTGSSTAPRHSGPAGHIVLFSPRSVATSTKRVLVAYGTKHGATAGIATEIGRALREDGLEVIVLPAGDVHDVRAYDAVVLGGALYAGRWSGTAKSCAERNADSLRHRPVWLFSSGPLDDSAEDQDIPPVSVVARQMQLIGAREHKTFGGSVTAHTPGPLARAMLHQGKGGDYRNPERIRDWAHHISDELAAA